MKQKEMLEMIAGLEVLTAALKKLINEETPIPQAAATITEADNKRADTMLCPECNGEMQLRTNRSNGDKFWGCKKYPSCKGTRDSEGLSKQERWEKKYHEEKIVQHDGFSFKKSKVQIAAPKVSDEQLTGDEPLSPPVNSLATSVESKKTSFNPFAK